MASSFKKKTFKAVPLHSERLPGFVRIAPSIPGIAPSIPGIATGFGPQSSANAAGATFLEKSVEDAGVGERISSEHPWHPWHPWHRHWVWAAVVGQRCTLETFGKKRRGCRRRRENLARASLASPRASLASTPRRRLQTSRPQTEIKTSTSGQVAGTNFFLFFFFFSSFSFLFFSFLFFSFFLFFLLNEVSSGLTELQWLLNCFTTFL